MNKFGAQDMVAPLRRVLMKRPTAVMADADPALWHYADSLYLDALTDNHQSLVNLIQDAGAEVLYLGDENRQLADAVFTHDPSLVTDEGAILLRMGKTLRRGEEALHRKIYESLNIPILGAIAEPGIVEGGDCLWLDKQTLAVGMGFRTNETSVRQLREILSPLGATVHSFDLPVLKGGDSCLHLMSLISLLDYNLALVYEPLLPVRFYQLLKDCGIQCLCAPKDEYEASGAVSVNALALAPRRCVMAGGFSKTVHLVQNAGCEVLTFPGEELCIKAEGGPTCLTRPIWRELDAPPLQ